MRVLITGVAGFIGSAVALKLLSQGKTVFGIDDLNSYYSVELKRKRLARCNQYPAFTFQKLNITDRSGVADLFAKNHFDVVIHLAAQAGVRHSVQQPDIYVDSNIVGFLNVLEGARHHHIQHFVYASSSSVYGANVKLPFSEKDPVDHPLSLYGATKRANELMAHSYAHLYQLPCTGLRLFTVYGPWGRPDMALFKFAQHILQEQPIPVYNYGKMMRDFTYIDDMVEGIVRIMEHIPQSHPQHHLHPAVSAAPYRIYNVGNHQPVELQYYIEVLEACLGKKAKLNMLPLQAGDVFNTDADVRDLEQAVGKLPHTPIEVGVAHFVEWYKAYYHSGIFVDAV